MRIHTFNTGAGYSPQGQRIAWAALLLETSGTALVGFYDADRGVHNLVRVFGQITNDKVLDEYKACKYVRSAWMPGETVEALRQAAEAAA